MPKFAPHTLPKDASRPQGPARPTAPEQSFKGTHPAILLGQHIRRERGMHGVRGYTASIRDYLSEAEYNDLCANMGVDPNAPAPKQSPPKQQESKSQSNPANQMQALSMLAQMMGNNGGGNANPLSALMGGQGGGINPSMLSGLLGGQGNSGGGSIDPMMLYQLLGRN